MRPARPGPQLSAQVPAECLRLRGGYCCSVGGTCLTSVNWVKNTPVDCSSVGCWELLYTLFYNCQEWIWIEFSSKELCVWYKDSLPKPSFFVVCVKEETLWREQQYIYLKLTYGIVHYTHTKGPAKQVVFAKRHAWSSPLLTDPRLVLSYKNLLPTQKINIVFFSFSHQVFAVSSIFVNLFSNQFLPFLLQNINF